MNYIFYVLLLLLQLNVTVKKLQESDLVLIDSLTSVNTTLTTQASYEAEDCNPSFHNRTAKRFQIYIAS